MEKIGRFIVVAVVAALAAAISCYYVGKSTGRTEMMVEAVTNNYGHYKIVNDLGYTQFEWGPPAPGSPAITPSKK